MNRLFLLIFLGFTQALFAQNKVDKIDSLMQTYYENELFNGTVLVAKQGETIYKKAFGIANREWQVPMTIDTKFKIGSISKPFTALLILQLVENGVLDLNGTITDYVPEYRGVKGNEITIHQLLTHTSGIIHGLNKQLEAEKERLQISRLELIRLIEEADLRFDPGTRFGYSSFGYDLLAYISEQVTGKSYAQLIQENICEPIGLNSTKQYVNTDIEEKLAAGYEYKLLAGYENATYLDYTYNIGAGGIISTVEDMFSFDKALYTEKLLSQEYKDIMYQRTKMGGYGSGWWMSNKVLYETLDTLFIASHSGSVNGYNSDIIRVLSDSSLIVILRNERQDSGVGLPDIEEIGENVLDLLYNQNVEFPKKSIGKIIAIEIGKSGIDSAINKYHIIKESNSNEYSFEENELNKLGLDLYWNFDLINESLKILELNIKEFPKSYNTYDSYAYVLMETGQYEKSIDTYMKGFIIFEKYPEINNTPSINDYVKEAEENIKEMEMKLKNNQ